MKLGPLTEDLVSGPWDRHWTCCVPYDRAVLDVVSPYFGLCDYWVLLDRSV